MKYWLLSSFTIIILILSGCNNNSEKREDTKVKELKKSPQVFYINKNDKNSKALLLKGAKIAKITQIEIGKHLTNSINNKGVEAALNYCHTKAMHITDSISNAEGVIIKRLAKKNRNPINEMSDNETIIYKQFILEWLNNKPLDSKLAIDNNGHPVYYKPMFITKNCLQCHGSIDNDISAASQNFIANKYPHDKAVDFKNGQPRGMWAITFTDINVGKAK